MLLPHARPKRTRNTPEGNFCRSRFRNCKHDSKSGSRAPPSRSLTWAAHVPRLRRLINSASKATAHAPYARARGEKRRSRERLFPGTKLPRAENERRRVLTRGPRRDILECACACACSGSLDSCCYLCRLCVSSFFLSAKKDDGTDPVGRLAWEATWALFGETCGLSRRAGAGGRSCERLPLPSCCVVLAHFRFEL